MKRTKEGKELIATGIDNAIGSIQREALGGGLAAVDDNESPFVIIVAELESKTKVQSVVGCGLEPIDVGIVEPGSVGWEDAIAHNSIG